MKCSDAALYTPGFFRIEIPVRFGKKLFYPFAFPAINRDADARGELRFLLVLCHDFANAVCDVLRFRLLRFGQDESEFIAAIACSGIDGAAMNAQDSSQAAKSAAADQMAELVVDFFQAVKIEEQNGKGAASAVGALGFILEDVEQAAVVSEAGERIADGEMADLFEEARVIEKRATESEGVTADSENLSKNKGRIEKALRLAGSKLSRKVHPGRGVDGAVESGVFGVQAPAIPNHRREKNNARPKLVGAGDQSDRMAGDFRGQVAKSDGDEIGETDDGQKGAGDLCFRMPRTRNKAVHEQSHQKQESQNHPAEPPGDGSQSDAHGRILQELKEENAGGRQDGSGQKIATAEYQGDAVLGALETDESESGKNEGQQGADDLKVALKNGIRIEGNGAQPESHEESQEESQDVPQDDFGGTASVHQGFRGHTDGPRPGRGAN